jgi:hypothetical protein
LLGAQAGGLATLGNMFMRESDNTDYGNRPGIGIGRKIGMLKPQFKSLPDSSSLEDFGVISIKFRGRGVRRNQTWRSIFTSLQLISGDPARTSSTPPAAGAGLHRRHRHQGGDL